MNKTYENYIVEEVDKLKNILVGKQGGYGGSVFQDNMFYPGCDASYFITARISDKIQRIKALLASREKLDEFSQESLNDTLLDAAGYFILWSVYENHVLDVSSYKEED